MKNYFQYLAFIIAITLLSAFILYCTKKQPQIIIVDNGIPRAAIVISQDASEQVEFAAEELQKYLKKVSGAELPIMIDTVSTTQPVISIGSTRFSLDANINSYKLKPEGLIIKTSENNLFLTGKDDDGILFAVYDFLEKFLGVRWYWPGELGEVVPKKETIVLGEINIKEEPDFIWRNRIPVYQQGYSVSEKHKTELALWEKRTRWGGSVRIDGFHEFARMVPPAKYVKTHPEYYAIVDGKRDYDPATYDGLHGFQLCTTNPEVLKISVEYVRKYFDEHPEADVLNISPNDGRGFCECDKCRALDSGRIRPDKSHIPIEEIKKQPEKYTILTDRIFTFANQIGEAVQQTHPGKSVLCYVYSRYKEPPDRIKIHPSVFPLYTSWSAYLHANEELRSKNEKRIKDWTQLSNNVGIYEYIANVAWPGFPRLVVSQFAQFLKFLNRRGIRLLQTQTSNGFAINGINYYVVSKMLWDTRRDENKILDDFYKNAFQEAGSAIKRFHKRQMSAWAELTSTEGEINCSAFGSTRILEYLTPEFLHDCRSDLTDAAALARDDLVRERVEFFSNGFRYTELTADAIRKTKILESNGIEMFPFIEDTENLLEKVDSIKEEKVLLKRIEIWKESLEKLDYIKVKKLVEEALTAWEKRDQYVERMKDEFVLPYLRIQKNNNMREFNPRKNLKYMQEILQSKVKEI